MQFYTKSLLIWIAVIAISLTLRQWPLNCIYWVGLIAHLELLYGPLIAVLLAAQDDKMLDSDTPQLAILALQVWVVSILLVVQFWILMNSSDLRYIL